MPTPIRQAVLSDEHRDILKQTSGLTDVVIDGRGYRTIPAVEVHVAVAREVYDTGILKADGWMGIPVWRPDGQMHCEVIRLDGPARKGYLRYRWPKGLRQAIDVHPDALKYMRGTEGDPFAPLLITEGQKKGDSLFRFSTEASPFATLALNGCWGWRARVNGASIACPDWLDVPLGERSVFVVVDSDYLTNTNVRHGWNECLRYLASKAGDSKVYLVVVPPQGMEKQGADDYLLHHTLDDLLSLATHPDFLAERPITVTFEALTGLDIVNASQDDVQYHIKPLLPASGVLVVAGHTQAFKTWGGLAFALDAILGNNPFDHPEVEIPEPINVLYVNKEMGRQMIGSRLRSMLRHPRYAGVENIMDLIRDRLFFMDDASLDLNLPGAEETMIRLIETYEAKLIFLDSLSMCWTGEENSAPDVGHLYQRLRRISQETGVSWAIIHHFVKPSKERKGIAPIFSVRGSGQIIQQADSALLMELYSEPEAERRLIQFIHGKARTSDFVPSWLVEFNANDGFGVSLDYAGRTADQVATQYVKNPSKTAEQLSDWILEVLPDQPIMATKGLRYAALYSVLKANWPKAYETKFPNDKTVRKALSQLCDIGHLTLLEENRHAGNLYIITPQEEEPND